MSAVFSDAEESLGTGIDRQVNKLTDLEEVVNALKRDLPSLKRQCERFKTEKASLQTEIQSLLSERDSLRIEMSAEHDKNVFLHEIALSGENDLNRLKEGDSGKANRKIWALEQQIEELKRDSEVQRLKYKEEMEKEVGVSNGLRDRIGTLDEKRRKVTVKLEEAEGRESGLKGELEALRASTRIDIERLGAEVKEARAALASAVEKERQAGSQSRVQMVLADQQPVMTSPRRALQKRPSNITHPIPVTPTKTQPTPSHPSTRKRATSFSPTSLRNRVIFLEERYDALKGDYDRLRNKYCDDIKHWKEWRAAEVVRKEEKKKRRRKEMRKATTPLVDNEREGDGDGAVGNGMEAVTLIPPSQESVGDASASQGGSQRVTRSQAKKRKAEDEDQSEQQRVAETIFPLPRATTNTHRPETHSDWMHADVPTIESQSDFIPPPPSQKRRITRTSAIQDPPRAPAHTRAETPTPILIPRMDQTPRPNASSAKGRVTPAARVTPWLGGSSKPLVRTSSKPTMADPDHDPFNDDEDDHISPMKSDSSKALLSGVKTPLIRDRGEGPSSSLRRTLLARNMSTDVGDRSRMRDSASPAPTTSDSARKRGLDMTGLSPAQIAQERKKLSKMTPTERKVLYADYKGKGRYLRPDEVKTTVTEEFEIDPKQNNGLNYQYHDIQRGRAERKQMHGGDCECCNGYYEAVGPLPKYNAGPAWKDPSQEEREEDMTEAQVKEHQNKVSRHRETWVRPPTPPGYWQIGFPNTQDVEEQNRKADAMVAEKEAKIRREAAHRDSKWKKKA